MKIGGSVLPSSCPEILTEIPFSTALYRDGLHLQVVPNQARDTHELIFATKSEKHILADHPNGYSCHYLAKALVERSKQKALAQAAHLVSCGGNVSPLCFSLILGIPPEENAKLIAAAPELLGTLEWMTRAPQVQHGSLNLYAISEGRMQAARELVARLSRGDLLQRERNKKRE